MTRDHGSLRGHQDCTHLVCLTNVTSEPWLEQAFARVTRYNPNGPPWEDQRAAIYMLDTPKNKAIAERMNDEEPSGLRARRVIVEGGDALPRGPSSYVSLDGEKGRASFGVDGRVYTAEENDAIDRVKRTVPVFADAPPSKLLDAAIQLGFLTEKAG